LSLGSRPQTGTRYPRETRSGTKTIDWALYKERNLVERFFNQIKRFRRIALRCEKTIASFTGFVALACAMAWLA
jgi:putative transposase